MTCTFFLLHFQSQITSHSNIPIHTFTSCSGPIGAIALYCSAWNYTNTPGYQCDDGSTDPAKGKLDYSPSGSMDGPSTRTVIFPNNCDLRRDTNLNGVIFENGTFGGMMRLITPQGSEMHLVIESDWNNGSSYYTDKKMLFPHLVRYLTEDPLIGIVVVIFMVFPITNHLLNYQYYVVVMHSLMTDLIGFMAIRRTIM